MSQSKDTRCTAKHTTQTRCTRLDIKRTVTRDAISNSNSSSNSSNQSNTKNHPSNAASTMLRVLRRQQQNLFRDHCVHRLEADCAVDQVVNGFLVPRLPGLCCCDVDRLTRERLLVL